MSTAAASSNHTDKPLRPLTSLDVQFLAMEDGHTHGHVGALAIYDPGTAPGGVLTREALKALVAERLDRLDPFRWRLTEVPFGLGNPYWLDDPNPDLDYHIRELALPDPGDEERLTEQVGRLIARPLDRSRPLWELYLIHGLAGGRVAVLTKVHHAAVDGLSGAEILGALVELEPISPEPATVTAGGAPTPRHGGPGQLRMLARGLADLPGRRVRALRALPGALPSIDQVPTIRNLPGITALASAGRRVDHAVPHRAATKSEHIEFPRLHAPRTSVNQPIGAHRRVALSRQSLDEVKQIKNHFGLTVNDVVMAICAGGLRSWLDARGELPDRPLLTIVPVSTRTEEQRGTFGNHVTTMLAPMPTDIGDPEDRLHAAREAMRAAKARHQATPPTVLEDINAVIPPALFGTFVRRSSMLAASVPHEAAVNTIVSNVPGPPIPVYLAGARLEALYPVSAVAHGIGLNITVMSYCGELDFGIVADRDLVDDVVSLAAALREAQAELMALLPDRDQTPSARPAPRHEVTVDRPARSRSRASAAGARTRPGRSHPRSSGERSSPRHRRSSGSSPAASSPSESSAAPRRSPRS